MSLPQPDFFVGEHGDPLQVTMPFDATGEAVVIEVQKPGPGHVVVQWADNFTIAPTSVTRTVVAGELDVAGRYRCAVICTRSSPARVRKVKFEIEVADSTPQLP